MNYRLLLIPTLLISLLAGCSTVRVYDADVARDPENEQKEGVIYYPQRPYIAVKEPFVVEGMEGYVVAKVIGGFIVFEAPWDLSQAAVPLNAITVNKFGSGGPNATAGKVTPDANPGSNGQAEPKPGDQEPQTVVSSEETKLVTEATGTIAWDSRVPAKIDVNRFFDVVYLPDIDNPRTIQTRGGIGRATTEIALGPGDTLNKFNLSENNQEIGKFLLETLKTGVDLARRYGLQELNLPVATAAQLEEHGLTEGKTIVLKYYYLGEATPGLYPLVKRKEFQEIAKDSFGESDFGEQTSDDYLIRPEYPFTRVAFKVNRRVRLEIQDLDERSPPPGPSVTQTDHYIEEAKKRVEVLNEIFKHDDFKQLAVEMDIGGAQKSIMLTYHRTTHPKDLDLKTSLALHFNVLENVYDTLDREDAIETLEREAKKVIINWLEDEKPEGYKPVAEALKESEEVKKKLEVKITNAS